EPRRGGPAERSDDDDLGRRRLAGAGARVRLRVGAMLVLVAAQAVPADGGTSPGRCRITVRAISATSGPDPGSTDPKLAPIEQNLREFSKDFRFKNFRLLSAGTNDLGWKKQAQVELPGSR